MGKLFSTFITLLFFLIILKPGYAFASTIYFEDNFNGSTIDDTKWDVFQNGGNIELNDGQIKLSSTPGNNFPYIKSKFDPFPLDEGFILEFKINFPIITPWGVGLIVATSPPPNEIAYDNLISSRIITYYSNSPENIFSLRYFQDYIKDNRLVQDNNSHVIKVIYRRGIYNYYFDDILLFSSKSNIRPHSIFFGNPHNQKMLNENTSWSSINIDYIRIMEIPESPIVFIPGHGGSWSIDDIVNNTSVNEWTATPFIHVYDRLFNALENAGFIKDNGLFYPFYYDWRQKTDASSDKLEDFIENILQNKPPDTQVVILAHSYGGLVARNYLQRYGDKHGGLSPPVEKILAVASPHEGALESFAAWEGGEVWRDDVLQRMAFEIPISLLQTKYLTRKEALRNFAPSTLDLFPIFNFLIDENGTDIPINSMAVKNSWLSSLKSNLIGNDLLSAKINIFYGNSLKTLESIKITKNLAWYDKLLNNWEDGKPMVRNYSDEGDGTVLVKSAKINNVLATEALLAHLEIVGKDEGIEKIFALLDLGTPTITLDERPVFASALALILHSPAQLKVTDSNGSSIGFQSGVDLIPDADTDLQNKLIVISNPKEEYQVSVFGTDTGDYKLEAIFDDGTKKTTRTLEGITKSGQVDNYNININSDISISDTTGSYSFIQAKKQIEILKTKINNSTMNKNSKSTLIRLLNSRSKDIDDILSLISKNKKEKAGLSTESLIKSLFSFRTRLAAAARNEPSYLSLKETSWEIISLVKDGYLDSLTFPSYKRIYEQIQLVNKSLSKNESLLNKTSKKKNIRESAVSFALAKNMNDEMQKYILAGDYNKAYINSFLILYLIDESMSFSALL